MHLNMMPMKYRREQIIRQRLKQWSVVWGIALSAAVACAWQQTVDCGKMAAHLEVLEARHLRVEDSQSALEAVRDELRDLEQREAILLQLSQRRPMLSLLGVISQAARQCDGNVSVNNICWNVLGNDARTAGLDPSQPLLTLHGIGLNNIWVSSFAETLSNSEIMRDVELKFSEQTVINGKTAHDYHLVCLVY